MTDATSEKKRRLDAPVSGGSRLEKLTRALQGLALEFAGAPQQVAALSSDMAIAAVVTTRKKRVLKIPITSETWRQDETRDESFVAELLRQYDPEQVRTILLSTPPRPDAYTLRMDYVARPLGPLMRLLLDAFPLVETVEMGVLGTDGHVAQQLILEQYPLVTSLVAGPKGVAALGVMSSAVERAMVRAMHERKHPILRLDLSRNMESFLTALARDAPVAAAALQYIGPFDPWDREFDFTAFRGLQSVSLSFHCRYGSSFASSIVTLPLTVTHLELFAADVTIDDLKLLERFKSVQVFVFRMALAFSENDRRIELLASLWRTWSSSLRTFRIGTIDFFSDNLLRATMDLAPGIRQFDHYRESSLYDVNVSLDLFCQWRLRHPLLSYGDLASYKEGILGPATNSENEIGFMVPRDSARMDVRDFTRLFETDPLRNEFHFVLGDKSPGSLLASALLEPIAACRDMRVLHVGRDWFYRKTDVCISFTPPFWDMKANLDALTELDFDGDFSDSLPNHLLALCKRAPRLTTVRVHVTKAGESWSLLPLLDALTSNSKLSTIRITADGSLTAMHVGEENARTVAKMAVQNPPGQRIVSLTTLHHGEVRELMLKSLKGVTIDPYRSWARGQDINVLTIEW